MLNIDGVSSMLYYTSPYSISGAARGDSEQGDGARVRPGGLPACLPLARDENGTNIFRPYSKPNPFRGVEICSYSNLDI